MFSVDTVIVSTLAEFKALNIRPNMVVAKGKDSIADGWGGEFYWYAGDTTTPDDDWVVQCTRGEAGRYRRVDPRTDQTGITLTTLASLKAMAGRPPSVVTQCRATAGDQGGGTWVWRSGDQSANVSNDSLSGLWVAPDTDSTGASGAWQRIYSGYIDVRWFGAKGDGGNDTTAVQAAHATGLLVYYPGGYDFRFSNISINAGGIVGDGLGRTQLTSTNVHATTPTIECDDTNPLLFEGFDLTAATPSTAPPLFRINHAGTESSSFVFRNIRLQSFAAGINFVRTSQWIIDGCYFVDYSNYALNVDNQANGDSGDSRIYGCQFVQGGSSARAIVQKASGGLMIVGCKFNTGDNGYSMEYTSSVETGNLLITGCSFENFNSNAIVFARSSGSSAFTRVTITGNEFLTAGADTGVYCIQATDTSGFVSDIAITGNIFRLLGNSSTCIGIDYAVNITVSGNVFRSSGTSNTAVSIGVNSSNYRVETNAFVGLTPLEVNTFSQDSYFRDKLVNKSTGASAGVVQEMEVGGGRKVERIVDYTGQYMQEKGTSISLVYGDFDAHIWRDSGFSEKARLTSSGFTLASGKALKLGNAYVAGAPAATGYVTLQDSSGTTYKVLVST